MYITGLSRDPRPLHILSHYSIKGGAHIVPLTTEAADFIDVRLMTSVVHGLHGVSDHSNVLMSNCDSSLLRCTCRRMKRQFITLHYITHHVK